MDRRTQASIVSLVMAGFVLGACGTEADLAPGETDVTVTSSAIVVGTNNTTENQRYWGDYNGDGIDDLIIVTAGGSYEYLGLPNGGFSRNAWVRTDLTLGNVAFIPGRFHGPGPTDLLIVTAGGTYEYQGKTGGGFTPNVWVRTDLKLGQVQYTVGDWNAGSHVRISHHHDGRWLVPVHGSNERRLRAQHVGAHSICPLGAVKYTVCHFGVQDDIIITTAGGSYMYRGKIGATGFTPNVWVRNDLTLGNVAFVPGHFTGPGGDVFITTASGTYLYQDVAGNWYKPNVYVRTDWKLGKVKLTPGEFNGGADSVIVTVASGSCAMRAGNVGDGTSFSGFTPDVWVRRDLPLGKVDYFVGHFTDGGWEKDLIIQTAGGSYQYVGDHAGGFTANTWVRTDLPLGSVQYF